MRFRMDVLRSMRMTKLVNWVVFGLVVIHERNDSCDCAVNLL